MTEQQEWLIAWLAAGGVFIILWQIVKLVWWIIKKLKGSKS